MLLYLEGCEKAEQLFDLLNLTTQARVLITTRDPDKSGGGHPHEVHSLDPESAAKLLHHHATFTPLPADTTQRQPWFELARRLGHHPLALRLAGTYLQKRKLTPAAFLQSLTQQGFKFWDTNQEPKENLRVMFQHCADAAKAKHARALEAWFALALHAHAPVPLSALCGALSCAEHEAESMLGALQDYSLAEPTGMPGAKDGTAERAWLLTHALLGEWAREQWLPQRSAEPAGRSAEHRSAGKERGVHAASTPAEEATLKRAEARAPEPAAGQCPALPSAQILTAWLDWWEQDLRHCLKQRCIPGGPARYESLQPHWNALLTNLEQTEGSDSTRLSLFLNATASAHQDMGNYSAAEPLYRRGLEVCERVLGPEHPSTLTSINNLAALLKTKCDLAAAEPLYRRALETRERVLGPEHPDTLTSVNNLAGLLEDKGDLAAAEPLYRQALEGCERVLGPEHPNTLTSINNLALLLQASGDLGGAIQLKLREMPLSEKILGAEHPQTLSGVINLGMLLEAKGDLAAAEPLLRRALEACERVLGQEHPSTIAGMNNLAMLLRNKGDLAAVEPLYRRALETRERVLGPEHPDTLTSVNNLAGLLYAKGDFAGALPLSERAAQGALQKLGPEHPHTKLYERNLAKARAKLAEQKKP